jgi:hypothetical protein
MEALRTPGLWWVNNVRMDLGDIGYGDVDWIDVDQVRGKWRTLVNAVVNIRVP